MAFSSASIDGEVLVVDSVHSPGYVAGSTGWSINKDGTAEFNNLTARGTLEVNGNNNQYVKVYNDAGVAVIEMNPPDSTGYTWVPASLKNYGLNTCILDSGYDSTSTNDRSAYLTMIGCSHIIDQSEATLFADVVKLNAYNAALPNSGNLLTLDSTGASLNCNLTLSGGETLDTAWTSYTPVWSASTTDPTIGNGTKTGRYKQIGKTVFFRIRILMGGTTTYGSGLYAFSLPVASFSTTNSGHVMCYMNDSSLSDRYIGVGYISSSLVQRVATTTAGSAGISSTVPFTFASGDEIMLTGVYEAA